MKKILTLVLALSLLLLPFSAAMPTADAATTEYQLFIYVDEGVEYVKVRVDFGEIQTFTSFAVITVEQGKYYAWEAKAKTGYTLGTTSGTGYVNYPTTLRPVATAKSFTVSVTSWTPSEEKPTFTWSLSWASGKSLTGNPSDYVTMTIAADTKSVTLTFKKDFSVGEMVLTCYAAEDHTVKATCTVKCSS